MSGSVWVNKFFVFWHFLELQRFSPLFSENIKQLNSVKVLISTVFREQYFAYMVQFKIWLRNLSTLLIDSFMIKLTFLILRSAFLRNLNHCWKFRKQKKNIQIIPLLMLCNFTMFWFSSASPLVQQNLISSITKVGIHDASRVAERLNNELLVVPVKKYAKVNITVF